MISLTLENGTGETYTLTAEDNDITRVYSPDGTRDDVYRPACSDEDEAGEFVLSEIARLLKEGFTPQW